MGTDTEHKEPLGIIVQHALLVIEHDRVAVVEEGLGDIDGVSVFGSGFGYIGADAFSVAGKDDERREKNDDEKEKRKMPYGAICDTGGVILDICLREVFMCFAILRAKLLLFSELRKKKEKKMYQRTCDAYANAVCRLLTRYSNP